MRCYEFGPSSRSRLSLWSSEAFRRDHHEMACRLLEQARAGCRPVGSVAACCARAGSLQAEARTRPAGKSGRRGLDRIVTLAQCGGARWRRAERRLVFRLMMSRWQVHYAPTASEATRWFCLNAVASQQVSDAAPGASFPYFSITSTDATRGAIGRPSRPSQRILADGERVSHGQQNDHRRLPPGRNPAGGPAR